MSRALVARYLEAQHEEVSSSVEAVLADLDALERLMAKWQRVQNLVSRETPGAFWTRHVLDSLQLLPLLGSAERVTDLGSGGGFPALPLAICAKATVRRFDLVESNGRKCAFLNAAKRELGLPISVHAVRIERFSAPAPDVITARALAALPQLIAFARALAGPRTRLLFHKGRDVGEELTELDSATQANVVRHPSLSDPDSVVLEWAPGTFGSLGQ